MFLLHIYCFKYIRKPKNNYQINMFITEFQIVAAVSALKNLIPVFRVLEKLYSVQKIAAKAYAMKVCNYLSICGLILLDLAPSIFYDTFLVWNLLKSDTEKPLTLTFIKAMLCKTF